MIPLNVMSLPLYFLFSFASLSFSLSLCLSLFFFLNELHERTRDRTLITKTVPNVASSPNEIKPLPSYLSLFTSVPVAVCDGNACVWYCQ